MDVGTLTGQIELDDQMSSALTLISQRVKIFTDTMGGSFKVAAMSVGLVTGAIAGAATAIIALGNRGSDINDLTATLERFTGSGQAAADVIRSMRDGTMGTVNNFDLMKSSTKLLSAGVKLTADNFGVMSKAAFVLQNQGLGPTKDMLDMVSQAMLTGRTRMLEMKIGKIDLSHAEQDYAKTLNVSEKSLTDVEKIEAKRIAILAALEKRVKAAGTAQRDFGEQMEYAVTAIKNWGDALAARVASSTAVTGAVDAIGAALKKAFGGTSQTLMDWVIKWIDRFANAIATYGPPVIEAVGQILDKIVSIYRAVLAAWDAVPEWFRNIAKQAIIAGAAVGVIGVGMGGITGPQIVDNLGSLAAMWGVFGSKVAAATLAVKTFVGTIVLTYSIGGLTSVLAGVAAGFAALAASTGGIIVLLGALVLASKEVWNGFQEFRNYKGSAWDYLKPNPAADNWLRRLLGIGKAARDARDEVERLANASAGDTDSWQMSLYQTRDQAQGVGQPRATGGAGGRIGGLSDEIKSLAATLSGAALQKKVDELTAAWKRLNPAQQAVAVSSGRLMDVLKPLGEQGGKLAGQLKVLYESHKLLNTQLPVTENYNKIIKDLARSMASIKLKLPPIPKFEFPVSNDPLGIIDFVTRALIQAGQPVNMKLGAAPLAASFSREFKASLTQSLSGIGDVIKRALEGGGNVMRAVFGSLALDLGKFFSDKLSESIATSVTAKSGEVAGKAAGALASGFITAWLGVMSYMISDILKPSYTAIEQLATKAKMSIDELKATLRSLGAVGAQVLAGLTASGGSFFDNMRARMKALTDGTDLIDLLGQFQTKAQLQAIADNWKAVYDSMLASGNYTLATLAEAWKKYQDAQDAALGNVSSPVDDIVAGFPTRAQLETAASNAEAAYIRIRDSGLHTAGQVERAFLAWQDAMIEAGDAGTIAMRKLDEELKGLIDSVKDEAPEEVMGVVEAAARARIAAIELERAAAGVQIAEQQTAEQAASAAAARAADEATEHIHSRAVDLDDRLRKMFAKGYEIPIWFNSGGSTPPHAPSSGAGGSVSSSGGGGTAVINIDGETLARVVVPRLPGVVQQYGLG